MMITIPRGPHDDGCAKIVNKTAMNGYAEEGCCEKTQRQQISDLGLCFRFTMGSPRHSFQRV